MARIKALNITLAGTSQKEQLAEVYRAVIENVSVNTVSGVLKNTALSGNPQAGTVEVKRFVNSQSQAYGTARTAGKGTAVQAKPITVALDQNKEIVEEIESFDAQTYGIAGILAKRAANHVESMTRELDTAFFATAVSEGTQFTTTATDPIEQVEALIAAIQTTSNGYVDGVDRNDIAITVDYLTASKIRNALDKLSQGDSYKNGLVGTIHGVDVYTSNHLPAGVSIVGMRYDSIAQPVIVNQYETEKIPLSGAHAAELFYKYGTKAVTEDLIQYIGTPTAGALG